MKLSYNWLRELVDVELGPRELAAALTGVGLVVDTIEELPDGDARFDAEVTTNRPDWLGHLGVAREIAAFGGKPVKIPDSGLDEQGPDVHSLTSVTVEDDARDACPRYTARVIRGLRVGPSPEWLEKRLLAIGQRPINNVVDVTNLVQFEMNQPLHAFDLDWLRGGRIVVRRAAKGEPFAAITGEEGALDGQLVIADAERAVALAGVKGGKNSEVGERTQNILIEAAYFNPAQVRRAGRAMKMASESSYRFERGIDPGAVAEAGARAARLILELAGGTLARGVIDTNPGLGAPREVRLRFARIGRLLGLEIEADRAVRVLEGLGLVCRERDGESALFSVPTFRADLTREADLIEEVARLVGYGQVPAKVDLPLLLAGESRRLSTQRTAREVLVGLGYFECFCDAFVPADWCPPFTPAEAPLGGGGAYTIQNPVNAQRPRLRTSLVPSLLEVRATNRLERDVRLFEINRVYFRRPDGGREEREQLAILDDRGPSAVRGAFEAVAAALKLSAPVEVAPVGENGSEAAALSGAEAGWTASMGLGGACGWAVFGQVSAAEASRHGLRAAPAFGFCDLAVLSEAERRIRLFSPLPRFPGVRRDIALVVDEGVRWEAVASVVRGFAERGVGAPVFESVYRGAGLPAGKKSLAFSFVCRSPERSLTDEEANALRDAVASALFAAFPGAALRG